MEGTAILQYLFEPSDCEAFEGLLLVGEEDGGFSDERALSPAICNPFFKVCEVALDEGLDVIVALA